MSAAVRRSFGSLEIPNYRRYFVGQLVSLSGNWMQIVAEMWLVLRLTGSGLAVGLTAGLQFLPILLGGAWGGLLADRLPKRRLLLSTQAAMAIPALILFGLTVTHVVVVWMVLALVFVRGAINAIDNPTRQSFLVELVGPDRLVGAVGLSSALVHGARIVGPAVAGVLIATAGVAPCFLLNALSFAAMFLALRRMDPEDLRAERPSPRERGQLRAALRYVNATPALRVPLAMMAVVGTLAFNFQVLLPLMARFTFDGDATTYALLMTTMGIGSVIGALGTGTLQRVDARLAAMAALAFGALLALAAGAPSLPLELLALLPLGAASVAFAASVNTALQLSVAPEMRGRVMALYSVVFLGSTPLGGPLAGWLAEVAGPRAGFALGAVATLVAGGVALLVLRRAPRPAAPVPASPARVPVRQRGGHPEARPEPVAGRRQPVDPVRAWVGALARVRRASK